MVTSIHGTLNPDPSSITATSATATAGASAGGTTAAVTTAATVALVNISDDGSKGGCKNR